MPRPFHEPLNQRMECRTLAASAHLDPSKRSGTGKGRRCPSVTHWMWAKSLSRPLHLSSCKVNQRENFNFSGTFSSHLACSSWGP